MCIVQEQAVGLCHFLVNDCKESLPHWKKLLLQQNGAAMITPSELCGITDNEFFYKVLPTGKCTGINAFQQCLQQCSCPKCKYLLDLLSDLSIVIEDDEVSTSNTQQRNDWYVHTCVAIDHSIILFLLALQLILFMQN